MVAKEFDGMELGLIPSSKTGKGASILRESARCWHLVINNPAEHGITDAYIDEQLAECQTDADDKRVYHCRINELSLEISPETGVRTKHKHLVFYFRDKQRGGWFHKRFPTASLQACDASVPSVVMYIQKDTRGAWYKKHPEKLGEKLPPDEAAFYELGTMPQKNLFNQADYSVLQDISEGKSDYEILAKSPALWKKIPQIQQARNVILEQKFSKKFRGISTTYIEGDTGVGKTRFVMESTNYEVFKIDDYAHPWDGYSQEDTVFFDEFRSQPSFSEMLRWLDGNPVTLKARYVNPVACFERVYIASNWTLEEQYAAIRNTRPKDWAAFLRRIHHRRIYNDDGTFTDYDNNDGKWIPR